MLIKILSLIHIWTSVFRTRDGKKGLEAIKKIMVAVLLSLSMVVSFMPTNVFATEAVDIWDGTADTSWYVDVYKRQGLLIQKD